MAQTAVECLLHTSELLFLSLQIHLASAEAISNYVVFSDILVASRMRENQVWYRRASFGAFLFLVTVFCFCFIVFGGGVGGGGGGGRMDLL